MEQCVSVFSQPDLAVVAFAPSSLLRRNMKPLDMHRVQAPRTAN